MNKILLPLVCAVLLSACGGPKIDASSQQALKDSLNKMSQSLPPEKQAAFAADLRVANLMAMEGLSTGDSATMIQSQLAKFFDGKTVEDIHAMAEAHRQKQRDDEAKQARYEAELQGKCVTVKPGTNPISTSPDAPSIEPGQIFRVRFMRGPNSLVMEASHGKSYTYRPDEVVLSQEMACGVVQD